MTRFGELRLALTSSAPAEASCATVPDSSRGGRPIAHVVSDGRLIDSFTNDVVIIERPQRNCDIRVQIGLGSSE